MILKRLLSFGIAAVLVVLALTAVVWWEGRVEHRYDTQIRAAAQRYGVDPALVKAVVWNESHFKAHARGSKGEIGLMQLQELAAQEWADAERIRTFDHEHCIDPGTNTLAGTHYLAKLLRRYTHTDDPVPYALADYNAGRSNALKWMTGAAATNSAAFIEQIGFPSTKNYVKVIMERAARYKPEFQSRADRQ
ncbi:MAG TPA: lytic transglycosylase domain-containing protein [Verrucomicrobiota bacterium]|nr:lytic transglycosylase domain-containing protein [Verrucomicrobiota bacterium]